MKQHFTSAATAVNGKAGKLPAIYNKIGLFHDSNIIIKKFVLVNMNFK